MSSITLAQWNALSFDQKENACRYEALNEVVLIEIVKTDCLTLNTILEYQRLSIEFIENHLDLLPNCFDKFDQDGWTILSYGESHLPFSFIQKHKDRLWMSSQKIKKEIQREMAERKRVRLQKDLETIMCGHIASDIASYFA